MPVLQVCKYHRGADAKAFAGSEIYSLELKLLLGMSRWVTQWLRFINPSVVIWFCNPAVTRIPDAHFFWEAKYNGTEVISISPDFNATAMHASKWLNPKPGSDIALAMAMIETIIVTRVMMRIT